MAQISLRSGNYGPAAQHASEGNKLRCRRERADYFYESSFSLITSAEVPDYAGGIIEIILRLAAEMGEVIIELAQAYAEVRRDIPIETAAELQSESVRGAGGARAA